MKHLVTVSVLIFERALKMMLFLSQSVIIMQFVHSSLKESSVMKFIEIFFHILSGIGKNLSKPHFLFCQNFLLSQSLQFHIN